MQRASERPRLLLTAGPTHEPIDAVRFLGNRSSGRVGVAIASAAADRGWDVRLLLGPASVEPPTDRPGLEVVRFRSTADLEALLAEHMPWCDTLIMAAAVSDYRPVVESGAEDRKIRRTGEGLTLHLEATPDLLAGCSQTARPDQRLVGFALEPRERLRESALAKLDRKGIGFIVANPLETMDAGTIEATLFARGGEEVASTGGPIPKTRFAGWLLDALEHPGDPAIVTTHAARADTPCGSRSTRHRTPTQ